MSVDVRKAREREIAEDVIHYHSWDQAAALRFYWDLKVWLRGRGFNPDEFEITWESEHTDLGYVVLTSWHQWRGDLDWAPGVRFEFYDGSGMTGSHFIHDRQVLGVADLLQLAREDAEQLEDGDLTRFEEFGGEIRVWVNHLGWVEIDRPGQATSDQVDGWDEVRQLCSALRELA